MYTETSTLSSTHTTIENVPAPYGKQGSIASHAPLVRTQSESTVRTALSRCSRPTADTGILVSNTASEADGVRLSLSCVTSAVSDRTYAFFALPLRLSGDTPESRRGGAVTFSLSRHASCEGARESRGSHAAGLQPTAVIGCMWRCVHSWSWDFCPERSHMVVRRGALNFGSCNKKKTLSGKDATHPSPCPTTRCTKSRTGGRTGWTRSVCVSWSTSFLIHAGVALEAVWMRS